MDDMEAKTSKDSAVAKTRLASIGTNTGTSKMTIQNIMRWIKVHNLRPLWVLLVCLTFLFFQPEWNLAPKVHLDSGDKDVIGSALGALLGTLGAFLLALFAAKKQREDTESSDQKMRIRGYARRILDLEIELNLVIPILIKNERMLHNCANPDNYGNFMGTLPRTFQVSQKDLHELRNDQLINSWATLCGRAQFINQLIEDFNSEYKHLKDTVYDQKIMSRQIDTAYVIQSHQSIAGFAQEIMESVQRFREQALEALALLQLFGDRAGEKMFESVEELSTTRFSSDALTEKTTRLSELYTEDQILQPGN
jgi:hypothetical protein